MILPWLVALVVEVAVLGAVLGLADRWVGRALGGHSLKVLWGTFFAKLALPVGLVSLPWKNLLDPLVPAAQSLGVGLPAVPPGPFATLLPDGLPHLGFGGQADLPWEPLGWGLFLVPAVILLGLLFSRVFRAKNTLDSLDLIEGSLKTRTSELARQVGLSKPVRLLRTAEGTSPASWGLFQSAILVPPGWEVRFPEKEQDQILLHELVHLKNRDSLLWLVVQVMTCLYWFHPAVWLARGRLLLALEGACDQQVLALSAGRDRTTYGRALLRAIEESVQAIPVPGTRAAAEKKDLKRRIQMIQEYRPRGRRTALILALCFLTLVSLIPVGAEENPTPLTDDIHRPFVDDWWVKGQWKVVDFVEVPEEFVLGKTFFTGAPFLQSLTFYDGGRMGFQTTDGLPEGPQPWLSWTKGVVMNQNDVTASAYFIRWQGFFTQVMFWEWKSGDYTIRHMKPWYYVLVKQ